MDLIIMPGTSAVGSESDSRREVFSNWRKFVHFVLPNRKTKTNKPIILFAVLSDSGTLVFFGLFHFGFVD